VNASWFIAIAYLANLYYTTRRDYRLTIQTCDNLVEVYQQSLGNGITAEQAFPFLISSLRSAICDKDLQAIIGFLSLGIFVFRKDQRPSVQLGVCPVQFALYIKHRCVIDHWLRHHFDEAKRRCEEHANICEADFFDQRSWMLVLCVAGNINRARARRAYIAI